MRIFISSQRIDGDVAARMIVELKRSGFDVRTSPRNPLDGVDDRWREWYGHALPEELEQADVFIAVIDQGWDSSTWMAIEADEAQKRLNQRRLKAMWYYNPEGIEVKAAGMTGYLTARLPNDLTQAIRTLKASENP